MLISKPLVKGMNEKSVSRHEQAVISHYEPEVASLFLIPHAFQITSKHRQLLAELQTELSQMNQISKFKALVRDLTLLSLLHLLCVVLPVCRY